MSVKEASERLGRELARIRAEGHDTIPEADSRVNDASRAIVDAMAKEHGEAWLALVNPRNGEESLWKWDGSTVYNFGADMVLPCDDAELRRLLAAFRQKSSIMEIKAIHDRLSTIGGQLLIWG